jgi:hypothetical protein
LLQQRNKLEQKFNQKDMEIKKVIREVSVEQYLLELSKQIIELELIIKQLEASKNDVKDYDIEQTSKEYGLIKNRYDICKMEYDVQQNKLIQVNNQLSILEINYDSEMERENEEFNKNKNDKLKELIGRIKPLLEIKILDEPLIRKRYTELSIKMEQYQLVQQRDAIIKQLNYCEYNDSCEKCMENKNRHNNLMEDNLENPFDYGEIYLELKKLEKMMLELENNKSNLEINKQIEQENQLIKKLCNELEVNRNEKYIEYRNKLEKKMEDKKGLVLMKKNLMNSISKLEINKVFCK